MLMKTDYHSKLDSNSSWIELRKEKSNLVLIILIEWQKRANLSLSFRAASAHLDNQMSHSWVMTVFWFPGCSRWQLISTKKLLTSSITPSFLSETFGPSWMIKLILNKIEYLPYILKRTRRTGRAAASCGWRKVWGCRRSVTVCKTPRGCLRAGKSGPLRSRHITATPIISPT